MFGAIYQGEECSKLSIAKLNKLTWKYKARNIKKSKKIKCYKNFINKQELISIKMWERVINNWFQSNCWEKERLSYNLISCERKRREHDKSKRVWKNKSIALIKKTPCYKVISRIGIDHPFFQPLSL